MSNVGGLTGNVGGSGGIKVNLIANFTVVGTGAPTINKASSNVTSVTERGTGRYSINHLALPSALGNVQCTCNNNIRLASVDGVVTTTLTPVRLVSTGAVASDNGMNVLIAGA